MRLSGTMDSNQGVAVAALVDEREIELQGRPPVALADHAAPRRQDGGQRGGELGGQAAHTAVWGIEENQIVLLRASACRSEEGEGVAPVHPRVELEGSDVAPDRVNRGRRAVDQRRRRGP